MTVKEFYKYCEERGLADRKMVAEITDGLGNTCDLTDLTWKFIWFDAKNVYISDCDY